MQCMYVGQAYFLLHCWAITWSEDLLIFLQNLKKFHKKYLALQKMKEILFTLCYDLLENQGIRMSVAWETDTCKQLPTPPPSSPNVPPPRQPKAPLALSHRRFFITDPRHPIQLLKNALLYLLQRWLILLPIVEFRLPVVDFHAWGIHSCWEGASAPSISPGCLDLRICKSSG